MARGFLSAARAGGIPESAGHLPFRRGPRSQGTVPTTVKGPRPRSGRAIWGRQSAPCQDPARGLRGGWVGVWVFTPRDLWK